MDHSDWETYNKIINLKKIDRPGGRTVIADTYFYSFICKLAFILKGKKACEFFMS